MSTSPREARQAVAARYRLVDYARTVRTGCRGADTLFVHMATLGNQSGVCWQTDKAMGEAIGASERSVTRWLPLLIRLGHIQKTIIERNGRRRRAFKLVGPRGGGQVGAVCPPIRRPDPSQPGGQNPLKRILSEAERREYARLSSLPNSPERFAALAAFALGNQSPS